MSKLDLAWAAGFFDGEGHSRYIIANKKLGRNDTYFVMSVKQVELSPLKRFCEAVKGGKIYGPYTRNKGNGRPIHQWNANGKMALDIFNRLRPYLSKPKVVQANSALRMIRKITKVSLKNG